MASRTDLNGDVDAVALGLPEDEEEALENALHHGLNLIAGYSRYPQRGWAHEGVNVLKVRTYHLLPVTL